MNVIVSEESENINTHLVSVEGWKYIYTHMNGAIHIQYISKVHVCIWNGPTTSWVLFFIGGLTKDTKLIMWTSQLTAQGKLSRSLFMITSHIFVLGGLSKGISKSCFIYCPLGSKDSICGLMEYQSTQWMRTLG